MWSQQAGTTYNSCPNRTSNMGLQAILSNRQTSNWETSAVRQAFSSQQPALGKTNNDYPKMLHNNRQGSFTNTQSGNAPRLDTNGHQVATQQDFYLNSGFFKGNTTYSQPGMAGHLNQQDIVQTHSRQNIHNQNHRQNGTHHGYSPTDPLPSYNVVVSQSFRNNNITRNSSSEQIFHSSSWKTQQYPYHRNSNHNNTHYVLSKTNNDTQEQIHRNQVVARIADELRKSCTAIPDGCPPAYNSSSCREKQFFSACRMTKPNQNMQSVTMTVSQSHNSNASQSLNSGLTLPNTSHNFMSERQHSVDLPQQSSVSNVFGVPATVDGSGNGNKAASACFKSPNDPSQLKRILENIPPQKKTESDAANSDTILGISGTVQFVTVSDDNIHSSPGRIATRAVAVVPPLSQEYYEAVSMHKSSDTSQSPPKDNLCKIQVQNKSTKYNEAQSYPGYPEIPNHSAASNDSNCSAGHQALSQKQLCLDDGRSKLDTSVQVDQCVASTAQQSVTSELPVSSSGHKDRSENQTDPKGPVSEVSAATSWTIGALIELVQDIEKAQTIPRENSTVFDYSSHDLLLSHFWEGNAKNLTYKLKMGWYKDLMGNVLEFCHKHVTSNSVILPQENSSFKKQPQNYHVLKSDEVYSEQPYKSPWLNVNEELDYIDIEFGFPWSLKQHLIESHSQPEQFETINSNPAQLVDSSEEKQTSTVEATTTQAASPDKTESADSSDPYYSFKIQVLPPEEARIIFEQTQSQMPQSMDKDSHPEKNSLVGVELPEAEDGDVTLKDSTVKNTTVCPIEQICCISRWMEMICGSDSPDLSKCQCENDQSLKDCTDKTPEKEENATCSPSELCDEPSQIIDLTKNDHNSYSHSEPKNISQISGSKSSIVERKRKRLDSHDSFFPLSKKSNECNSPDNVNSQPSPNKKVLADDSEPSSSNVKSVQLVLFGSAPQDSHVMSGYRRRHVSSSETVSDGALMPPKYLSVNLSPLSGKSSETVPTREYTVKRWIYENWRRSFPPFKSHCRSKHKTKKCAFSSLSGLSLRKGEMVESTRIWNQNPKHRLSLTRRRSLRDRLKSGKEKRKMDVVPLKQPADKDSTDAENGSHGDRPLQENSVLKFNVLPSTFNFKDRSNEGKEINGSFTNKTALDEGKDSSPNNPLTRERGTWYPKLEKKYCPLRSRPVLKNSSIFHEYQKKYKEKTQPLVKE